MDKEKAKAIKAINKKKQAAITDNKIVKK